MRARDPVYEESTGRLANPEAVALRRWIHERYLASPEPLPGRFRYYEAVMAQVIAKHAAQTVVADDSGQPVTAGDRLWKAALMWVREHGLVPDAWIEDRTRHFYNYSGYASVVGGVLALLDAIPLDPWRRKWPLVFVESEASGAVIGPVVREYRGQMAVGRGQAGRAYLYNVVAPQLYEAALVPPPRRPLLAYHGLLAPRAEWRSTIVPPPAPDDARADASGRSPRRWPWARLLHRVFAIEILVCDRCGGPRRILGAVTEPHAVRRLLAALGLAPEPPPGRPTPAS